MNSKDVKRVMFELVSLINSVNYVPWMEDEMGFKFMSNDGLFVVEFGDDEFTYQIRTLSADLEWVPCDATLEDLDKEGVSWEFTEDILNRFEDTILEVQEHIRAHESDIALFERTVNNIAGETILSCL